MAGFGKNSGDDVAEPYPADRFADDEAADYDRDHADQPGSASLHDPDSGVKRGLKNRHLSMMALAGIIGPGLLVGAGGALSNGGPASLIIGFGVIGEPPCPPPPPCFVHFFFSSVSFSERVGEIRE